MGVSSNLAYLGSETGERQAFGRSKIGVLPPLGDPVETGPRRLLPSAPHLGTPQPEQVTDRVAALQAGVLVPLQHGQFVRATGGALYRYAGADVADFIRETAPVRVDGFSQDTATIPDLARLATHVVLPLEGREREGGGEISQLR